MRARDAFPGLLAEEYLASAVAADPAPGLGPEPRLAVLDRATGRDPWNPFLLMATARQRFALLRAQGEAGEVAARGALGRIELVHARLGQVAGFGPEVGQIAQPLRAHRDAAAVAAEFAALYRAALGREPDERTLRELVGALAEGRASLDQIRAAIEEAGRREHPAGGG